LLSDPPISADQPELNLAVRPGRNEPCFCGSGLKFKKCHQAEMDAFRSDLRRPSLHDLGDWRIRWVLTATGHVGRRAVLLEASQLEASIFADAPEVCAGDQAVERLIAWKDCLESKMAEIISTQTPYFWFFLTQRLNLGHRNFDLSPLTMELYRRILKLAIVKYGGAQGIPATWLPPDYDGRWWITASDEARLPILPPTPEGWLLPSVLPASSVLKGLLLERFAYDFWWTTALLRRVWKGELLRLDPGRGVRPEPQGDSGFLIDLYDERLKHSRPLSSFGAVWDPNASAVAVDEAFVLTSSIAHGAYRVPIPDGLPIQGKFTPRYVPSLTPIEPYADLVARFREPLAKRFGLEPFALLTALVSLSLAQSVSYGQVPKRMLQLALRGYVPAVNRGALEEWIREMKPEAERRLRFDPVADGDFAAAIEYLFYSDAAKETIDLWDRSGGRIFLEHGQDSVIVDYSSMISFLDELFDEIRRIDGEYGVYRGTDFEDYCLKQIESTNVPGVLVFRNEELRARGTTIGEIDIGWRIDNVLILVECKARGIHRDVDKGVGEALAIRERDNLKSIAQIVKATRVLREEFADRIPEGVNTLMPIVATPFPEYVPERSPLWLIHESTPRIMTPFEVIDVLKSVHEFAGADDYAVRF